MRRQEMSVKEQALASFLDRWRPKLLSLIGGVTLPPEAKIRCGNGLPYDQIGRSVQPFHFYESKTVISLPEVELGDAIITKSHA
jgi:hypothetical protein